MDDESSGIARLAARAHRPARLSEALRRAAHDALSEALAVALGALDTPECARWLGPIVPGATMPGGARIPGTSLELDPVQATFNLTLLLHWPSTCAAAAPAGAPRPAAALGGLLATADWLARRALMEGRPPLKVRDLLAHLMAAHEVECALAVGLEPVVRLRVATAAIVTALLGGSETQVAAALRAEDREDGAVAGASEAQALALADAAARGVRFALLELKSAPRAVPLAAAAAVNGREGRGGAESIGFAAQVVAGAHAAAVIAIAPASLAAGEALAAALSRRFRPRQVQGILAMFADVGALEARPVNEFVARLVAN